MARFRPFRWLGSLLFNHWGSKATALVLAIGFFITTREDVTRDFTVPVRVLEDPERVLRTSLPGNVRVEVHGSWSRINRLTPQELGSLTIDVRNLSEGRLVIDESTLEMPEGVILRNIIYDRVDVRFDPMIEREFPIRPDVIVTPHEDYEHVETVAIPPRFVLRGPKTVIQEIDALSTEREELKNISRDVEISKSVLRPRDGVQFVGMEEGERPVVRITIRVKPKTSDRTFDVPITLPEGVPRGGDVPSTVQVTVRGPQPELRRLGELPEPIHAAVTHEKGPDGELGTVIVDFLLGPGVPEELAMQMSLDPARRRYPLPPPGQP